MDATAIGIDLGATKIAAALVKQTGEVLAARSLPTRADEGVSPVVDRIAELANELGREAERHSLPLLGLGIGSPGLVNAGIGIVHNAVNLGWKDVYLVDEVKSRLERTIPVWVQKDGNASAIGENIFGSAQNCPDFLYLTIGTGLGGGLFAGGQLITGANNNATELGHISLDPLGRECACGLRGCAETTLSGDGLVSLYMTLCKTGKGNPDVVIDRISPAAIIQAARANECLAVEALAEMGRQLGMVIAFCLAVTNPALVVIGGGLGLAVFDLLLPHARKVIETRVLEASYAELQILPSRQKSSAVGAASLAWYYNERR